MHRPSILSAALLLSVSPVAVARDLPFDLELDAESLIVLTPLSDEDELSGTETVLGELSLNGKATRLLENGVRLQARTSLRLQKDHPTRPGFSGGFGNTTLETVGAFSGTSSGLPIRETSLRGRLEMAYVQVDGGYGELRLGKNQGVADRFHEGAPEALKYARLDSPILDPSGLAIIRTRHDLTGPSAKLSYATPRILGIRAGVSYTPEANADGLDRRPSSGSGAAVPDITNAFEVALNGGRQFGPNGLRLDASAAWSTAEVEDQNDLFAYTDVETTSAGLRLEKGDISLGGSWLSSSNGYENADYNAWTAGVGLTSIGLDWSLNYGESEDGAAETEAAGWRFGAARDFSESLSLGLAYSEDDIETGAGSRSNRGLVVEITLSQDILNLSGN